MNQIYLSVYEILFPFFCSENAFFNKTKNTFCYVCAPDKNPVFTEKSDIHIIRRAERRRGKLKNLFTS